MERITYIILLVYYIIGAAIISVINKNKTLQIRKESWLKYFTYIGIITLLFSSILYSKTAFYYISIVIIIASILEIFRLIIQTKKLILGLITLVFLSVCSYSLYEFSLLDRNLLLFVISIVTVFDSASQLSGQLFGKNKLFPKISPNKTIEGLIGGFLMSILTSYLIHNLLDISILQSMLLGFGISSFAFLGDFLASFCKRWFEIKDFSKMLPGQGGFLDRFDSLFLASLFIFYSLKL